MSTLGARLRTTVLATTATAFLSSGAALVYYDFVTQEESLARSLDRQAAHVGNNLTAALSFGDVSAAREILEDLSSFEHLRTATLLDAGGTVVAGYRHPGALSGRPSRLLRATSDVKTPEGETGWQLVLERDLDDLLDRTLRFAGVLLFFVALALLQANFLSGRLKRSVLAIEERDHQLRLARDDLEARVQARTRELASEVDEHRRTEEKLRVAKDAAEASLRAKGEFLANMSHEIRTPMNGILATAELMLAGRLEREERELAEILCTSAEALLSILDDVLEYSKLEAGQVEIAAVELKAPALLGQVVALFSGAASRKGLALELECHASVPPVLRGDPGRLRQVVANLVGNAVKFTLRGRVCVRARAVERTGGRLTLRIEVEDSGIGIAREKLELVFERFTQVDASTTRQFGGTGLGLAIARGLVERMQGRIGVESELGRGSLFWLEVPLGLVDRHQAPAPVVRLPVPEDSAGARGSALRGARVLVAEDNAVNRAVATKMLERLGCVITHAADGVEAVARVEAERFDAVLMDCQMPNLDGLQATGVIRQRPGSGPGELPIIALTANAMPGDRERCLESGMDDFLAKPLSAAALREVLERWVRAPREQAPAQSARAR